MQLFSFLPLLFLFLFSTVFEAGSGSEQLMMCKCYLEKSISDDGVQKEKNVYIYLVRGKDGSACCENPALSEYPGIHERHLNQAPKNPGVWSLTAQNTSRIDAVQAQKMGCSSEEKVIEVIMEEKFSPLVKKYYPELNKD
mgnify:CR=1 FL=1